MGCQDCAQRYIVVFLGFIGLLISIGYRTCFALVMVHVTSTNTTGRDRESIWHNCSVTPGSSADLHVNWSIEKVFLFHTAYFCGSLVTQLPGGILATKFSSKLICGWSIFISSVLFFCLPVVILHELDQLVFLIRIVQGVVEGCSIPALNGVISAWAPALEKSRLITIAYAGAYISPAIGLLSTGLTTCYISWNSIFYIYGGCGVMWSLVWIICIYDKPNQHPRLGETERRLFNVGGFSVNMIKETVSIPWRAILSSMPVYAIIAGAFCRNWIFSMLITEQPQYFKDVYNMHTADIGLLSALPHLLMTIVVVTGGVTVDKLIKHRYVSITMARKLSETIGFGIEAICIMVVGFMDRWQDAFILFCVGVGFSGLAISGYQVNPLDLSPRHVSVLTGLSRLGTLGAILGTLVASQLTGDHSLGIEQTRINWRNLFITAACIHLVGVVFYAVFASGKRQEWSDSPNLTINISDSSDFHNIESDSNEKKSLIRRQRVDDLDDYGSATRFLNTI